jgi:hypothetical protein
VIAAIAEVPWTPQRANVLRSAWIPAPPPESEPAIVIATGMRRGSLTLPGYAAARGRESAVRA